MSAVTLPSFQKEDYTLTNLFHYQPVSAHLSRYISLAGASIYEASTRRNGKGAELLRGISQGVYYAGFTVNSLLAFVETIISLVHSIFASIPYNPSKPMAEKYFTKAVAHFTHSLQILGWQVDLMWRRDFEKLPYEVKGQFHLFYLEQAVMARFSVIKLGKNAAEEEARKRAVRVLVEGLPRSIHDICNMHFDVGRRVITFSENHLKEFSQNPYYKQKWQEWLDYPDDWSLKEMLGSYCEFLAAKNWPMRK